MISGLLWLILRIIALSSWRFFLVIHSTNRICYQQRTRTLESISPTFILLPSIFQQLSVSLSFSLQSIRTSDVLNDDDFLIGAGLDPALSQIVRVNRTQTDCQQSHPRFTRWLITTAKSWGIPTVRQSNKSIHLGNLTSLRVTLRSCVSNHMMRIAITGRNLGQDTRVQRLVGTGDFRFRVYICIDLWTDLAPLEPWRKNGKRKEN